MSSEGKSSGPSSDDQSYSHPLSAFGSGGPSSQPIYDVASALPQGSGPPNQGSVGENIGRVSAPFQFGFSSPFSAESSAISGVGGSSGSSGGIFSSIANPGGNGGNPISPASFGGAPVDAFGSAPGAASFGASAPASGSPVSAAAAGLPSGVNPDVSPDPTQKAGAPLPPGSGSGGFSLDSLLTSAGKSIASNPLGVAAGIGGLVTNIAQGQHQSPALEQLQQQASQLNEQGRQLASYLQNGNLPPGLKAGLDEATAAAKARVIQNFANQGAPTDPTKNSALAAQLAAIDQQAIITTAQIGQQLLGSGVQQSGMASSLYNTLAQIDQTQTQRIGQSIANFAAALSPSRGFTLNLSK